MVDITLAFRNLIIAKPAITGIVGSNVFNDALPQTKEPPAIVFWIITEQVLGDLTSSIPVAISQALFTCRCYGRDRTEANKLSGEMWRNLDGITGIHSTVAIHSVDRDGGVVHTFDEPSGGTDQRRFISQLDFLVSYDSVNTYGEPDE